MPETPEQDKGFRKPEGRPIDKRIPHPGPLDEAQDMLENERSDRESGRPLQLGRTAGRQGEQRGRGDAEPGMVGRQHQDHETRKPPQAERTKR